MSATVRLQPGGSPLAGRVKALVIATIAVLALAGPAASRGWSMELTSNDFAPKGVIPVEFTCQGQDKSPEISWSNVPEGTKSFALTVLDPDAPGRDYFVHWVVYDIPASVKQIPQGGPLPQGAKELPNDFGKSHWGGPCPRSGPHEHHYVFTIYALDVRSLGALNRDNWVQEIKNHSLGSARLEGHYAMH